MGFADFKSVGGRPTASTVGSTPSHSRQFFETGDCVSGGHLCGHVTEPCPVTGVERTGARVLLVGSRECVALERPYG